MSRESAERIRDRENIALRLGWTTSVGYWISPKGISYDWPLRRAFNPWINGSHDAQILEHMIKIMSKGEIRRFMSGVVKKWGRNSVTDEIRWWKYRVGDYADILAEIIR